MSNESFQKVYESKNRELPEYVKELVRFIEDTDFANNPTLAYNIIQIIEKKISDLVQNEKIANKWKTFVESHE